MYKNDKMCKFCNKVFSSKQMANLHMTKKVCKKRANLFCLKCNKKFKNKRDFQRHAKNKKKCIIKSCLKLANDTYSLLYENSNSVNLKSETDGSFCEELLTKVSKKNPKNGTISLNREQNGTFLLNNISTPNICRETFMPTIIKSEPIAPFCTNIDYSDTSMDTINNINTISKISNKQTTAYNKKTIKKTKHTPKGQKIYATRKTPILTHVSSLVRKNITIELDKPAVIKCSFCSKCFKKKYNKNRHEKKYCKFTISKIQELENKIKNMELNLTNINNSNNKTTIINNTYNIQTTNKIENDNSVHNIININSFGHENTSGISKKDMISITNKCFGAVLDLFQKIHLDTPENRNLYLPEVKNKHLYMKEDDKWVCVLDYNPIFKQIQDNNIELIEDFILNNKDIFSHSKKRNINRMIESYHSGQLTDGYNKQLKELLYNNRNLLRPLYINDKK